MRFSSCTRLTLGALVLSITRMASGERVEFQSQPTQTALLELYTSEGCSSCPPAEAWLSKLKQQPGLWKDFVPLAFHVHYWDYLGWKDRLASKTYTERQRDYAAHWGSGTVYTPGFVLNGQEWRGWSMGEGFSVHAQKDVGVLTARSEDSRRWTLQFQPSAKDASTSYDFHAALLGFELATEVKAGENRGHTLEHDFVVLAWAKSRASKNGESFQRALDLPVKAANLPKRLAFAAWVSPAKGFQPVQALGGWLGSAP